MLKREIFTEKLCILPIILYLIQSFLVDYTVFYVIAIVVLLCMVLRNRLKIPRIYIENYSLLIYYVLLIIFMALPYMYNFRDIIRDLFYITGPIFVMAMGYFYYYLYGSKKNLVYTLCVVAAIFSILNFITAAVTLENFKSVRLALSNHIQLISIAFAIALIDWFYKKNKINSTVNILLSVLFVSNIIICLSRGIIVASLGALIVTIINIAFGLKGNFLNRKYFTWLICGLVFLIVLTIALFSVLPADITAEFFSKVERSFTEISSDQTFNTFESLGNSWRGYEIYEATEMFNNANIIQKVLGFGAGKQISVPELANIYGGLFKDGTTPLLHNGFYTVLIKGGLVGLAFYILFFAKTTYLNIFKKRTSYEYVLLTYLLVNVFLQTYIIRGLIEQMINFWWCFLVGWISARKVLGEEYKNNAKNRLV